jgi:hypothetical protein
VLTTRARSAIIFAMTDRTSGNVPQSKRVKFKKLVANDSGPVGADEEVIDTQEEYDEWIAACTGNREAFPKFDFGGQMLIAVSAGERPTAGYRAQITGIVEITGGFVGIQWQVLYRVCAPRGQTAQVVTYPQQVVRTRRFEGLITFHRTDEPDITTLAVGEEDPRMTTLAVGEEEPQAQRMTTMAVGEEDPQPQAMKMTTLAIGEEDPRPTTLAVGEESQQATTLALGEEGPQPTTLAVGEEDQRTTTLAVGEEGPVTTLAVGEENPRATTLAVGEEGPFGAY